MLGNSRRPRGVYRNPRDLQVCWANTAKGAGHMAILQIAFQEQMDVVCVQEPEPAHPPLLKTTQALRCTHRLTAGIARTKQLSRLKGPEYSHMFGKGLTYGSSSGGP